jgi:hypothetical protein
VHDRAAADAGAEIEPAPRDAGSQQAARAIARRRGPGPPTDEDGGRPERIFSSGSPLPGASLWESASKRL